MTASPDQTLTGASLLRALVERAPVAMGVNDLDGRFVLANTACAEFFGVSHDEMLTLRWQELTTDETLPDELALVDELLRGERDSYRLVKPFHRRDGILRWGDLSVTCVRDKAGRPELLIGQIMDVTERENAVRLVESTLAAMIDPHVLFEVVRDADGAVVDAVYELVNDAALRHLSMTREDLQGRRVSEVLSPVGASEVIGWLSRAMAEGLLDLAEEPMLGSVIPGKQWYEIKAVPVGETVGFTWRNITGRVDEVRALAQEEARYRLLADNVTDVILRSGRDSGIEYVSPSVTKVLGWQPSDIVGKSMRELIHPDDLPTVARAQMEVRESGGTEGRATFRVRMADGGWRWVSDHGRTLFADDGSLAGGIDSLRDVQSEHDAQEAVALQGETLRGIIDSLIDPWVLLSAVRDESGTIVDFVYVDANDSACQHNHVDRASLIGSRLLTVLPEHEASGIFDRYADVVESGIPLAEDDVPFTHPIDGHVGWYDNRAVKVGDGISLTWRDVSERYLARQALEVEAEHDLLTGIANRRQLERRLGQVVGGQRRRGDKVAVLYLDLDNFKEINDTLGHSGGDGVLTSVAARLRRVLRDGDMVARVGGDEFVVVLDSVRSVDDASAIAEKLATTVAQPVRLGDSAVIPRVSVGVALVREGESAATALGAADRAMYEAKRQGRDRVVVAGWA